jgi:RNA polymerase sigma-70 factor (ECF subfamily)
MTNANAASTSPTLLQELTKPDNNEAAWRAFVERYQPMIRGWCRRRGLTHDQAEDVCATVLAQLVTALRDFVYDPARRFRGWLKTVVDNEMRTLWRRAARHPGDRGSGDTWVQRSLEQVAALGGVSDLLDELDQKLDRDLRLARQVTALVRARVHEQTWRAFWLTAIAKEPAADVAKRLQMTVAAVYMAKKRVGRMLHKEGARLYDQTQ